MDIINGTATKAQLEEHISKGLIILFWSNHPRLFIIFTSALLQSFSDTLLLSHTLYWGEVRGVTRSTRLFKVMYEILAFLELMPWGRLVCVMTETIFITLIIKNKWNMWSRKILLAESKKKMIFSIEAYIEKNIAFEIFLLSFFFYPIA